MSYDEDVCKNMQLHELYVMSVRIHCLIDDIGWLRELMKGWGFDSRNPLKSDSFIMPKLVQYEADLRYIAENVGNIIKDKEEASE